METEYNPISETEQPNINSTSEEEVDDETEQQTLPPQIQCGACGSFKQMITGISKNNDGVVLNVVCWNCGRYSSILINLQNDAIRIKPNNSYIG